MIHAHRWASLFQFILTSAFTGIALFLLVVGIGGQALPHEVQTVVNSDQIARLRADQMATDVGMKEMEGRIQSLTYEVTQIKAVVVTVAMASFLVRRMWRLAGSFVRIFARKEQRVPDKK